MPIVCKNCHALDSFIIVFHGPNAGLMMELEDNEPRIECKKCKKGFLLSEHGHDTIFKGYFVVRDIKR